MFIKIIANNYIIGIQGGVGSFNEEAINHYIKDNGITSYSVKYLHTTENVLKALDGGEIDYGQFALQNSVGGIVQESLEAMSKYKFKIVKQFSIKIAHALMIRKDAKIQDIDTIMTHPQVLAQCKNTIENKYTYLKRVSGKGKLIDNALIAKRLSEKALPKNIATMGSKNLAQIYDLKVVEDNLQDAKENHTTFVIVRKTKS
jgi:prephenate dehydratase